MLTLEQRQDDPRWIEAGRLFDATVGLQLGWAPLNPHAVPNIRYVVQKAALGAEDSGYDDPAAELEAELFRWIKPNPAGMSLLEECRRLVRSAAQAH